MGKIDLRQLDEFDNQVYQQIQDGEILVWDSVTNNGEFKPFPFPQGNGFGDNFHEFEQTGLQQTNSEIYQNYLTAVTPSLPAGNYIVFIGYIANTTASNVSIEIRTQVDGVDILPENYRQYGGNTAPQNERLYPAHFETIALDGVHTFTIDYRRQGNNKIVDIYHAHIVLWKVS